MPPPRLHADEVDLDDSSLRALIDDQFPQWAPLPLRRVASTGTENGIFRLGDELGVRAPRLARAVQQIEREERWLGLLAAHLPVAVHEPVAVGRADPEVGAGYPFPFLVYRWIEGEDALAAPIGDPVALATEVGAAVVALQRIDIEGAPRAGRRGRALATAEAWVQGAIELLDGEIDTVRARAVWADALAAGEWDRTPVWVHGDLLPGNVIVGDGRLVGLVDWSSGGVGDPACEALFGWSLPPDARAAFRKAAGFDDATWRRGRGWALEQAATFIPYYRDNLPAAVAAARTRLAAVLAADE